MPSSLGQRAAGDVPYWLEEPAEPIPRRSVPRPDAVVVGGGITGCTCARVLAERGLAVQLHEAREIASGASGRNGGFALRGFASPYDVLVETVGRERACTLWRLTEDALPRVAKTAGDAFRATGSLRLAAADEERNELGTEYEALRTGGFAAEWIDELEPRLAGRYVAAILHPSDGVLQPARWTRRLAAAAAQAGVEIREHSRVESVDEAGADVVVVATDGYPSGLLGPLEGLIIPTRGQVVTTEPIEERLYERPHYGRHGFDYWHQRPDGRIVAGGFRDYALDSEFTTEEVTTEPIQRALEEHVAALAGRPVEITHRWAGIFGLVPDFLPVVGRLPHDERLWVAGGYSGHGNVLGLLCGELVAGAILGRPAPEEIALFAPSRLVSGT